jgi:hypothetical protein
MIDLIITILVILYRHSSGGGGDNLSHDFVKGCSRVEEQLQVNWYPSKTFDLNFNNLGFNLPRL